MEVSEYVALVNSVFQGVSAFFIGCMIIWLVLLFYMLFLLTECHFSPALQHLAHLLHLTPDIAAVTLLAFGNGAPDFFSALVGADEAPDIIVASSIGSGIFIVCVVFGCVILAASSRSFVLLRWQHHEDRKYNSAAASIQHLNGKSPSSSSECHSDDALISDEFLVGPHHEVESIDLSPRHQKVPVWWKRRLPRIHRAPFVRSTLLYLLCILFLAGFCLFEVIPFWLPITMVLVYVIYLILVVGSFLRSDSTKSSSSIDNSSKEELDVKRQEQDREWEFFLGLHSSKQPWYLLRPLVFDDRSRFVSRGSFLDTVIWYLMVSRNVLCIPLKLVLNVTIFPLADPRTETDSPMDFVQASIGNRMRVIFNPPCTLVLLVFWFGESVFGSNLSLIRLIGIYAVALLSGLILSALLWMTTSWTGKPCGRILHFLCAFFMCIVWMYHLTLHVINCLRAIGKVFQINDTVLGVFGLALGNSFGDLIANVAIARAGSVETAVIAVFSGPIQNILLTIGVAFLVKSMKSAPSNQIFGALKMDNLGGLYMYISLLLLVLVVLISLIAVPFVFRMRIPRLMAPLLLIIYVVYLSITILGETGVIPALKSNSNVYLD